jgi:hypothetical protein
MAESWRCDFNENRPHSALGYQTPKELVASLTSTKLHSYQPPELRLQVTTPTVWVRVRHGLFRPILVCWVVVTRQLIL